MYIKYSACDLERQDELTFRLQDVGATKRRRVIRAAMRDFDQAIMQGGGGSKESPNNSTISYLTLPFFFPRKQAVQIKAASQAILEALNHLELKAVANPDGALYQHLLGALDPDGLAMALLPRDPSVLSMRQRLRRLDGHIDHKGVWKMIEVNQVGPRGLLWDDEVRLLAARVMDALGLDVEPPTLNCPAIAEWFVLEYEQRYGAGCFPRRIAISVDETYPSIMLFAYTMQKRLENYFYQRYGERVEVIIATPCNFHISGKRMFAFGKEVDLVWCNTYSRDWHHKNCTPSWSSYIRLLSRPEEFLVVNHPSGARLTRTKGSFPAIIWDDDLSAELDLSFEELEFLRKHVVETHHLELKPDFLKRAAENRFDWFFKPSDAGMGTGAFSGRQYDVPYADFWDHLTSEKCRNFVAQRHVPPHQLELYQLTPNTGKVVRRWFDTDYSPFIIGGKITSALMRGKLIKDDASRLLNLSSGEGWVIPVF